MSLEKKAKKYLTKSEVVFITSDGVPFFERSFAKAHADKNGLKITEFKNPKKTVRNGTK